MVANRKPVRSRVRCEDESSEAARYATRVGQGEGRCACLVREHALRRRGAGQRRFSSINANVFEPLWSVTTKMREQRRSISPD